jgi:hypothetical protein
VLTLLSDDPSTAATLDWKTNEDGALNSKITAEGFTPVSDTNSELEYALFVS